MKLRIKLDQGAFPLERAHDLDAGYDIRTRESHYITYRGCVVIDTGVHVEIPEGYVGMIKSRSGLNFNHSLVCEGVIDSGYTGSIRVKLYNLASDQYHLQSGDKIAQLVILPIATPEIEIVKHLKETERGDSGFGSTGR